MEQAQALVLARASAPFFKWASANDLCAPTFLERCLAALDHWEPRIDACVHLNIDGARARGTGTAAARS